MTCPICGRRARAALLLAVAHHTITPDQLVAACQLIDTTKEHDMHITSIRMGDIGEEIEEWEVVPLETGTPAPVEQPAPSEPVPA